MVGRVLVLDVVVADGYDRHIRADWDLAALHFSLGACSLLEVESISTQRYR